MDSWNNEPDVNTNFLSNNQKQRQVTCKDKICWKCNLWMIITSVFILVALITTVTLVLYSHVYVDEDEKLHLESPTNDSISMFVGSLQLKQSCLLEPSIRNETTLLKLINNAYRSSPALQYRFLDAEVLSAKDEDNAAVFRLNFSSSSMTVNQIKYIFSKEFVGAILSQNIYDQEIMTCRNSGIVVQPIDFTNIL
ncbi:TPA-induced transmembrane protein [Discoglossus pictus]